MPENNVYQIETEAYKGPFDLLIKAIDDGQVDIYNVSLSQITSAYFEYWKAASTTLVAASDFLFMAACLLESKSKAVLPAKEELIADDLLAGVEESLVSHIQEYEIFKNLAGDLKARKRKYSRIYGRHEGERQEREIELKDISLRDLLVAFQKVYSDAAKRESFINIEAEEVSLEDRIEEIKTMLRNRAQGIPFEDIFIRRTRLEIVVTFLAILELAKQNFIRITQGDQFGSILIIPKSESEREIKREPEGEIEIEIDNENEEEITVGES
jgi:segregation and condensation protein A